MLHAILQLNQTFRQVMDFKNSAIVLNHSLCQAK